MLFYTKVQCFNSTDYQPAIEGPKNSTTGILNEFYFFTQFFFPCYHHTCNKVAVASQVFGGTVHYKISSQRKRLLEGGCCKSIIHAKPAGTGLCQVGNGPYITNFKRGVGRRFQPDQFCVGG